MRMNVVKVDLSKVAGMLKIKVIVCLFTALELEIVMRAKKAFLVL